VVSRAQHVIANNPYLSDMLIYANTRHLVNALRQQQNDLTANGKYPSCSCSLNVLSDLSKQPLELIRRFSAVVLHTRFVLLQVHALVK
jgi:hypothetical protein